MNDISAVYFPGSASIVIVAWPLSSVVKVWFLPSNLIKTSFPANGLPFLSFKAIARSVGLIYMKVTLSAVSLVSILSTMTLALADECR